MTPTLPPPPNILESLCVKYEYARDINRSAKLHAIYAKSLDILLRLERRLIFAILAGTTRREYDSSETGYRYSVDSLGELMRSPVIQEPKGKVSGRQKLSAVAAKRRKAWKRADDQRRRG